jgi:hypothetical protein
MKIKSVVKGVYFENWKTPIEGVQYLWLSAVLQTASHAHFFFSEGDALRGRKRRERIYVMTIGRNWPYRIIEEGFAHACIGKYFRDDPQRPRRKSKGHSKTQRTWKLWGTSFIRELDEGKVLSDYKKTRDKNIFEYLIATMDERIEFVSGPPRWTVMRDLTVKAAVQRYLTEF